MTTELEQTEYGSFVLNIETYDEAFQPDPVPELCRILRNVIDRLERGGHENATGTNNVKDANGNVCGNYSLREI